ncbi:Uncharacterised protein [Staphylococcus aureus]|nr:Uncharacterised protein [Staphylococcus aureus]CAC6665377.1 Uncharacterised protein [Staphylococcus aureus]CPJ77282.1 Uncharacterised protein [Staphylococcus aureus]CPN75368.1 Uncharacterised protein [Staphylococcus aureus]
MIFKVPIINAQIPNLGSEPVGFQVVENRNSVIGILVKKVMVSKSNVINIPSVVKMEIAEIAAKITGIILSLCFPFLLLFFSIKALTLVDEVIIKPLSITPKIIRFVK